MINRQTYHKGIIRKEKCFLVVVGKFSDPVSPEYVASMQ